MGPIEPPLLSSFDCGDNTIAPGKRETAYALSKRISNEDAYQPCCILLNEAPGRLMEERRDSIKPRCRSASG